MDTISYATDDFAGLLHALNFAAHKHRHQRRKGAGQLPYINHPLGVANILWDIGGVRDLPTMIAAILHDTLEDTDATAEELEAAFGAEVCALVREVTDDKTLPKSERKQRQIATAALKSPKARQIKLADKISNIQDVIDAPPVGWSLQRRNEYINWAEQVINGLRGGNPLLERRFDELCIQARANFLQDAEQNMP